jgi:hypothetical protein
MMYTNELELEGEGSWYRLTYIHKSQLAMMQNIKKELITILLEVSEKSFLRCILGSSET